MTEEGEDTEPPGTLGESVCSEARLTLDQQLDRIEKYDMKAIGIFRLNVLLAGVLVSGLAIVVQTDGIGPNQFLNIWSIVGGIALSFSTLFAAMAYTSSSYDMGITPQTVRDVERGVYSSVSDFNGELRSFYKGWLEHNRDVGRFNSYLITSSIILLMNAIAFFVGSIVVELTPALQPYSVELFAVALLVVGSADLLVYFSEYFFIKLYPDNR